MTEFEHRKDLEDAAVVLPAAPLLEICSVVRELITSSGNVCIARVPSRHTPVIRVRHPLFLAHGREVAPFKSLADLSRIGMYPKEIEKMGKHNMLECLDVFPVKADSTRTDNIS